ncbi:MAG: MFS transporter [Eggerthellaceae bacterium]
MLGHLKGKRATIAFVVSSSLSLLGNSIAGTVLPLVLLATTGDVLAAGTLAVICAVPQLLAGVMGGAVLDRYNRRTVSIVSDFISAAAVAALPLVHMTVGLSFGWFVLFGVLGAIGDVPGMTARDTLLPSVVKHDKVDLQRFIGVSQSIDGIVTVVGPALAALSMGLLGATNALWFTAALSACAALATMFVPRAAGKAPVKEKIEGLATLVKAAVRSTKTGIGVLFNDDAIVRFSVVFTMLVIMVMGGMQGLVMPVYFTAMERPELLGYFVSAMSFGALVGSIGYASLTHCLKRRTWYVVSLIGMAVSLALIGTLPAYPLLLVGAACFGLASGPFSAVLNFYMFDRLPNEKLGAAMGAQNSMLLLVAPAAIFIASVLVTSFGVDATVVIMAVAWLVISLYALVAKAMRRI